MDFSVMMVRSYHPIDYQIHHLMLYRIEVVVILIIVGTVIVSLN